MLGAMLDRSYRRGKPAVLALVSSGDGGVGRLLTAVVLVVTLTATQCEAPKQTPKPTTTCHEGDSCWNCRVDGNKKCGPGDKGKL